MKSLSIVIIEIQGNHKGGSYDCKNLLVQVIFDEL